MLHLWNDFSFCLTLLWSAVGKAKHVSNTVCCLLQPLYGTSVANREKAGSCIFSCFLPKTLFPISIPKLPWLCACWLELFRFEEGRISVRLRFSLRHFTPECFHNLIIKWGLQAFFQVSKGFSKKIKMYIDKYLINIAVYCHIPIVCCIYFIIQRFWLVRCCDIFEKRFKHLCKYCEILLQSKITVFYFNILKCNLFLWWQSWINSRFGHQGTFLIINVFVETIFFAGFYDYKKFKIFIWNRNIINVFPVKCDYFNACLVNKSIYFCQNIKTYWPQTFQLEKKLIDFYITK